MAGKAFRVKYDLAADVWTSNTGAQLRAETIFKPAWWNDSIVNWLWMELANADRADFV